jgi:cytochrome c553
MKRILRSYGRTALVLTFVGILGAFVIAISGIYSVAASRGHWAVAEWFLQFGLRRSVNTHAMGIETPDLSDPAMVAAGAGHYEIACATCHGAPGQPLNPITLAMLPPPPYLPDKITNWQPRELFWITKHGLKYTGMPGWPARGRDDEVWSVVAALVRLPQLSGADYRALVGSDTDHGPETQPESMRRFVITGPSGGSLVACARCHGVDGAGGGNGAFPRLAGQSQDYLLQALTDYAEGKRQSGIMQPIAAALEPADRARLAAYFASRTAPYESQPIASAPSGAVLAANGDPARGVAACAACHATEIGSALKISPAYPRLAGQHEWYLRQQLLLWRQGRAGTPLSDIMAAAARNLTDEDIAALAAYYAALRP